jgi:hypothetical protein
MVYRLGVVLFLLAAFGCKKKEAEPVASTEIRPYHGTASATMNGNPWTGNVSCGHQAKSYSSLEDRFSIGFDRYEKIGKDSFLRGVLNISNVQYKVYKTDLVDFIYDPSRAFVSANRTENAIFTEHFGDGDVVAPPCSILLSEPHWLELSSYDPATRRATGKFAITILSHAKDTVRFESGSFSTLIAP